MADASRGRGSGDADFQQLLENLASFEPCGPRGLRRWLFWWFQHGNPWRNKENTPTTMVYELRFMIGDIHIYIYT